MEGGFTLFPFLLRLVALCNDKSDKSVMSVSTAGLAHNGQTGQTGHAVPIG